MVSRPPTASRQAVGAGPTFAAPRPGTDTRLSRTGTAALASTPAAAHATTASAPRWAKSAWLAPPRCSARAVMDDHAPTSGAPSTSANAAGLLARA
jgi:hypothetical protein